MNQEQFLSALSAGLAALGPSDRRQVAEYYQEMILDSVENGASEEEAVTALGEPGQIAAQICCEYGARSDRPQACEYRPEGAVHTVVVQADCVGVRVCPSADGRVRVWYAPRDGERVTAEEADGVFRFMQKPPRFGENAWLHVGAIVSGKREVVLELPPDFAGTVCAKTQNAPVCAADLALGGKAQLAASNARITVERCAVDTLLAKTSNGRVALSGLAGRICEAATDNARITAERCRLAQRLWLATSNGALCVEEAGAPDISLVTSNGAIKGTVLGEEADYAVTSRTSNARNELRDTAGCDRPCRLRAVTSNGSIKLRFAGGGAPGAPKAACGPETAPPAGQEAAI